MASVRVAIEAPLRSPLTSGGLLSLLGGPGAGFKGCDAVRVVT